MHLQLMWSSRPALAALRKIAWKIRRKTFILKATGCRLAIGGLRETLNSEAKLYTLGYSGQYVLMLTAKVQGHLLRKCNHIVLHL